MGRRRRDDITVVLFPFLSILVCVIGVLTLLIVGKSMREANQKPDAEAVAASEESRRIQEQLKSDSQRIEELSRQLESASGLGQARLEATRRELAKLEEEKKARDDADAGNQAAMEKARQLELVRERLAELEKEEQERRDVLAKLEKEIEAKGRPPEAVLRVRGTGSGTGGAEKSFFVECADVSVNILGDEDAQVRVADLAVDPAFLAVTDRVEKDPEGLLVFLVRPDGVATYWSAKRVADSRGARNGKIPLPGQGMIDLDLLKRRGKER